MKVVVGIPASLATKLGGDWLRHPEGRTDWATNGHWAARVRKLPKAAEPMPAFKFDAMLASIKAMKHELVTIIPARDRGDLVSADGPSGITFLQKKYAAVLDGLKLVRLSGKWKYDTGTSHGRKGQTLRLEAQPIAGLDADGEIVAIVQPYIPPGANA